MKKVISLALAMAMALSMTSMALSFGPVDGGKTPSNADMYPGETYVAYNPNWQVDGHPNTDNVKDFRLSIDWEEGSALVKSYKLVKNPGNNELGVEIELKENYTIDEAKDLVGIATLRYTDGNDVKRELEASISGTVANDVEDIDGGDNRDDATPIDVEDNTIYNVTSSGWFDFGGDGNRLSSVMVRLPEDKQVFAYWNEDPIEEIEDKYYDLDADIEYVNFVAKPNLGRNAEIAIQGDYSDQYYLYEVVNGDLESIDADWNEDDGLFEFTASKLGSYVISDKELVAEADEPAEDDKPATDDTTTQNPDTGANDVVGVAVALAAVSLVAAGAVSLKK